MAIVLSDGSAAALRAVDLAVMPDFAVHHDTEQLIVVHIYRESKEIDNLKPVSETVAHISKNKVAGTLNYKLETMKLPDDAPTAATPTIPETPPSHPPVPPAKGTAKGAAAAKEQQPVKVEEKPPTVEPSAASAAAQEPKINLPTAVASYVAARCEHHNVKSIFCGVGASQQGKSLVVGSVTKQIVSAFYGTHNLFCMKMTGPAVRPTAAMRLMVLVVPGSPLSHLQFALRLAAVQKKNDRVGVTIVANSGKAKPEEGLMSIAAAEADGSGVTPSEVSKQCAAILAAHGLSDGSKDDEGTQSIAQDSFPLINTLMLDPIASNPTPTIAECGSQAMKFFGAMKIDLLVLPPKSEGVLSDAFVHLCLAAPKPHVILTA